MLEIRKRDSYNFTVAERLKEPIIRKVIFDGVEAEMVSTHKNLELFYGNLYGAIKGLMKHSNIDVQNVPNKYKYIKPYDDETLYNDFIEVPVQKVLELIKE